MNRMRFLTKKSFIKGVLLMTPVLSFGSNFYEKGNEAFIDQYCSNFVEIYAECIPINKNKCKGEMKRITKQCDQVEKDDRYIIPGDAESVEGFEECVFGEFQSFLEDEGHDLDEKCE